MYKETVRFENKHFFEQPFKHQGYYLWDSDKENDNRDDNGQDAEGQDSDSELESQATARRRHAV